MGWVVRDLGSAPIMAESVFGEHAWGIFRVGRVDHGLRLIVLEGAAAQNW